MNSNKLNISYLIYLNSERFKFTWIYKFIIDCYQIQDTANSTNLKQIDTFLFAVYRVEDLC